MWVDASAKMPAWQRCHSLRACLPDQARGGAAGTPWRLRRSYHLALLASRFVSRLASQQCTQMPRNGSEGPFWPICVHYCVPTVARTILARRNSVHKCPKTARRGPILPFVYTIAIPRPPTTQAHGATVYTNAPKRPRGAISTDLCTLLRRRPGGEAHVAEVVTQPPTHTNSRSRYSSGSASAVPGAVLFSPSNLPKTKSRP